MTKNTLRQKGSAHIVIIIVIVVALLGGVGFVAWNNLGSKNESENNVTKANSNNTVVQSPPKSPEDSPKPYSLSDAVQGINAVFKHENVCSGSGVQINESDVIQAKDTDSFKYRGGKTIIDQQFEYAYVQYGCGSQGSVALMKRDNTSWRTVSKDARIYPMCDGVEGENFPAAIVDKCYESNASTEPRDIMRS